MSVEDLIAQLRAMPEDTRVCVRDEQGDLCEVDEVDYRRVRAGSVYSASLKPLSRNPDGVIFVAVIE